MPEAPRPAVLLARAALGVGLAASALGAWLVYQDIRRDAAHQFGFAADQVTQKIGARLRAYELILRGAAGLHLGSDAVSREEWRRFVEELHADELVPGTAGIGFAVAISPEQLALHESAVRAEGFPDYRVKPEGPREHYSAVVFLEPFEGRNLRAFGYDMYSEPVRRDAMSRARDTGHAALSGKVVLLQEQDTDVQAGTLMYVPVYRNGRPTDSIEQRREALMGWAYSPYRMNDLMSGLLKNWQTKEGSFLQLRIYDGSAPDPDRLLFDSANANGGGLGDGGPATHRTLDFHGHAWWLGFHRSSRAPAPSYLPAWVTLAGGAALSGLLFGLLMSLARTREGGLQLAHTMTETIRRREKDLEESEFRWRFALEGSGDGLWDWNLDHGTVWFSHRFEQLLGFGPGELEHRLDAWSDRIHPDDRERKFAAVNDYLEGRSPTYACEHRLRHKDGHYLWVLDRGIVVDRSQTGAPRRMIGTLADISQDKALEASLRRSRAELEDAQRIARFGSWTLDKASRQVAWTPEVFEMLGLPVDPSGQAPSFETHHRYFTQDSFQALSASVEQMLAGGTANELELEFISADGRHGWMQARGERMRAADGSVTGIHGVVADITERKQAALRLEQSNRLYTALSECNWAIVHCANQDELLERVCDVLVRHAGFHTAWVGRIDPASGQVHPACARGEGAGTVGEVAVSVDPGELAGRGPIGITARELRPVWIDEFGGDDRLADWQAIGSRFGWRTAAFLPLLRDRKPFAVLTLFSTQPGLGNADTRQLVEQIVSNVNFALDRLGIRSDAQAFRKLQQDSQERFRILVDASRIGAFIVQDGVIRYANPRAGELLGVPGPDALIGRRLDELAEPSHREVIGQALDDLTHGRARAINKVISAERPDGSRVAIGINATLASEGEHAPVLGLIEDTAINPAAGGA